MPMPAIARLYFARSDWSVYPVFAQALTRGLHAVFGADGEGVSTSGRSV